RGAARDPDRNGPLAAGARARGARAQARRHRLRRGGGVTMACDRLRELALLDVDDGLAADERAELDAHLAGCADCRAARDAARQVARGVRQLPVPPVPLGFSERTLQRLERAQSSEAR